MMTKQEVFTKVATHLLGMEKQSSDGQACYYRSPDGGRCAAGALIDDEDYGSHLEGRTADNELVRAALASSGVNMEDRETRWLVCSLQDIHDDDFNNRADRLIELAAEFSLDMPQ